MACSRARDRRLHVALVRTFCFLTLFYTPSIHFFVCFLVSSAILLIRVRDVLVVSFVLGGMDPAWTSDGCDMVCSWPKQGFARDRTLARN